MAYELRLISLYCRLLFTGVQRCKVERKLKGSYKINFNKKPVKLAITIPAYNEEASIGKVIKEIPGEIEGIDQMEIIVINDGSKDRTNEAAKEAGADKIINFTSNKGYQQHLKRLKFPST